MPLIEPGILVVCSLFLVVGLWFVFERGDLLEDGLSK